MGLLLPSFDGPQSCTQVPLLNEITAGSFDILWMYCSCWSECECINLPKKNEDGTKERDVCSQAA